MNNKGKPWTRDELILAINLYCKTTFGRIHVRNPDIIGLANKLGRTPGSVSFKLANFASLDPSLDREGAKNTSKLDKKVWDEFFNDWEGMFTKSEFMRERLFQPGHGFAETPQAEFQTAPFQQGKMAQRILPVRTNQSVFRRIVLSSYDEECCITGIKNKELLNASHIIPWAEDEKNRLNPMNGLCLNALHDRAFDKGLITLNEEYEVQVSRRVQHDLLCKYAYQQINLPKRFYPHQDFLEYHRTKIFQG